MRRSRRLLLLVLIGAAVAELARRRRMRTEAKVDLYHEDGSLVTVEESSPEGARLLSLAREIRRTAAVA
jgi:hypothetical protein